MKNHKTITTKITRKQKELLYLLYQFRFLNTSHFQKIIGHKNPKRTQAWLKDLKDKEYIKTNYSPKSFLENTRPAIYYLSSRTISILKENENIRSNSLDWIYKEKTRQKKFIDQCLSIADIYIFFLSQISEKEEIKFFTATQLGLFDYFPDPLPSGYISVKKESQVKRYFLEVFDNNTPSFVLRNRFKQYLNYFDSGTWQTNTDNSPFPTILFVCPNKRVKNHIYFYSKALLQKSFIEDVSLYIAVKDALLSSIVKNDIWEKVE